MSNKIQTSIPTNLFFLDTAHTFDIIEGVRPQPSKKRTAFGLFIIACYLVFAGMLFTLGIVTGTSHSNNPITPLLFVGGLGGGCYIVYYMVQAGLAILEYNRYFKRGN